MLNLNLVSDNIKIENEDWGDDDDDLWEDDDDEDDLEGEEYN